MLGARQERRNYSEVKKWFVAAFLAIGTTFSASAAENYFVTVDTVGNCSVVQSMPGTGLSAGKTAIGETDGYDSMYAAKKFLDEVRNDTSKCKGVVAG
jgi:hypothetical protein